MFDRFIAISKLRSFHFICFVAIGAALYGFTHSYPFVFDDKLFIQANPLIKNAGAFISLHDTDEFFSKYLPYLSNPELATSFALRPVAYLTFRLNYLLGGYNPSGYRLFNIVVHILNTVLLYQVLYQIISRRITESEFRLKLTIPLFAALTFLVHPLQTESVTYITQRFASLGAFFYLLSMLLYIKSGDNASISARRWLYGSSILVLLLGLFTKENVLTLPLALVLTDVILLRKPLRATLARLAPHLACLAIVPLTVISVAGELNDNEFNFFTPTDIVSGAYGRYEYALTQLRVVLSYFRLFVLPYNQNFDPDYQLFGSALHPEILISILIWLVMIAAVFRLLHLKERNICTDLTVFSIFWFIISISITSSFIPLTDLMFEHRTYLPSLAFCTGSTSYLHMLASGKVFKLKQAIIGLSLVFIIFSFLTVQRNQIYSSRITLWKDTVSKSPNKPRVNFALGASYFTQKRHDLAITYCVKAIKLAPDYIDPYVLLGSIYLDIGMPEESIRLFEKYLAKHNPDTRILKLLSAAYTRIGILDEAIRIAKLALHTDGEDVQLLGFIADLNQRIGNRHEAQLYLDKARLADQMDFTRDLSIPLDSLEDEIQDDALR